MLVKGVPALNIWETFYWQRLAKTKLCLAYGLVIKFTLKVGHNYSAKLYSQRRISETAVVLKFHALEIKVMYIIYAM